MPSPTSSEPDRPTRTSPLFPAGILEKAGIKLCIVGNATVGLFGSDLVLADLDLAIADEEFDFALSVLHNRGFCDIDFDSCRLAAMPILGKPGGWVARRLQCPPSSDTVVLSPASCWHMEINPDTTYLPHADPYRFPHFLVYLEGNPQSLRSVMGQCRRQDNVARGEFGCNLETLIRIIDTLVPIGDRSLLFRYQYAIMAELLEHRPELKEMVSPGDRFFMDFYLMQCSRSGRLRVLELRRNIMDRAISVEAASGIVPRPDLARKRIKEKYLQLRMEGGNGERNEPRT